MTIHTLPITSLPGHDGRADRDISTCYLNPIPGTHAVHARNEAEPGSITPMPSRAPSNSQGELSCAIFAGATGPTGHWKNGKFGMEDQRETVLDIISEYIEPPKPVTVERWVNVYDDDVPFIFHATRTRANDLAGDERIACVPITITYTPGEGL